MKPRPFFAAVTLLVTAAATAAQDREFIRALEGAQRERPAQLTASSRIAPGQEPGTPLVIHGRLFAADGTTPLGDAVVFAYHTDREGNYDTPGRGPHMWRLRGWAKTSGDGRFEFATVRPGAYPGRSIPAHVHFTVFLADGTRYHAGELQFTDDSLVPASDRAQAERDGTFGHVRPVRADGGTQQVDFNIRIDPRQKF